MSMEPVIELQRVEFAYDGVAVLQGVDLVVPRGEFLGIVGPNAGGKSTLLKLVLGLLQPQRGHVRVLGARPRQARSRMGYVPQYPPFRRDFPISVEQLVLMGRLGNGRWLGGYSRRDHALAHQKLEEVGIAAQANRLVGELSGGQLQRALIARALACEPEILVMDEPTANVDSRMEEDLFELLRRLNQRMTILLVSHDVGFVSGYVQRVACLNGTLVCHPTSELDGNTISELYDGHVCMVDHTHRETGT